MSTSIYVGNLSYSTTEDTVYSFFGRTGALDRVRMLTSPGSERPRGACVVAFKDAASAEAAVRDLQGASLDGRALSIRPFYKDGPPARDRGAGQQAYPQQERQDGRSSRYRPYDASSGAGADEPSILVGNLSYGTTEGTLRAHFGQFGAIESLRMEVYSDTGKPKGSAVVTFRDASSAQAAIQACEGTMLDGRTMHLRPYFTKGAPANGGSGGRAGAQQYGGYGGGQGSGVVVQVANLPFTATWHDLKDTFNRVGSVLRADTTRGAGTVSFRTMEEAQAAVSQLQGADLGGRPMSLKVMH